MLFRYGAGARNLLLTLFGVTGVLTAPAATAAGVQMSTYQWADASRTDPILQPIRPREIAVRLWSPGIRRAPVVVFATGRATRAAAYDSLASGMARRGYAVAIVESPHQSIVTLADGTEVPPAAAWKPTREMLEQFERADAFLEQMNTTVAADLRFAVQKLKELNDAPGPLRGALDLNRLGMGGHSNGAMAGARACSTEPRCKAFLGFEGTQAREIRTRGVGKPFGLLISEESLGFDREGVYRQLAGTTLATFVVYRVSGAGHNSITDLVLTTPELFKYEMSAQRGIEIGIAMGTAFFDCYLRGSKCVEDLAMFPEVKVEKTTRP